MRSFLSVAFVASALLAGLSAKDIENAPVRTPSKPPAAAAAGDFWHPVNGVVFPAFAAGMKREPIEKFDTRGENVSAGYFGKKNERVILIATVYSYPKPPELADNKAVFDDASAAILQNNQGARRVSSRSLADGGFAAEYEFTRDIGGVPTAMKSRLVLYGRGQWLLKYRFTYAASEAIGAEELIIKLMRTIGTAPVRS